ncbi:hypothetical protein D3C87_1291630 [compost metagenome]
MHDVGVIGDVEFATPETLSETSCKVIERSQSARGGSHAITTGQELFCHRAPEAAAGSGDQPGLVHLRVFIRVLGIAVHEGATPSTCRGCRLLFRLLRQALNFCHQLAGMAHRELTAGGIRRND